MARTKTKNQGVVVSTEDVAEIRVALDILAEVRGRLEQQGMDLEKGWISYSMASIEQAFGGIANIISIAEGKV